MSNVLDIFRHVIKEPESEEKRQIKHFAIIYERGKDSLKHLDPSTLTELSVNINILYTKLNFEIIYKDEELNDFDYIRNEFFQNNILYISTLHNNSNLFDKELNLKFRAIHDSIHIVNNYKFDYCGELSTYLIHARNHSFQARQVLFSEIVLQTCFKLYFGFYPEKQKIVLYPNIPNN